MDGFIVFSVHTIQVLLVFTILCEQCQTLNIVEKTDNRRYEGRYTRDISHYELVVPHKVHEDGRFRSFTLPHFYTRGRTRAKRDLSGESPHVHYKLPLDGEDHHVELWPNHDFLSPGAVGEHRGEGAARDVRKVRLNSVGDTQCHYTGVVRGHEGSRAALSVCDGLAGFVRVKGKHYFVEPVKDVEPHSDGQHLHIVHQASNDIVGSPRPSRNCATDGDWHKAWEKRLEWETLNNPEFGSNHTVRTRSVSKNRYLETLVVVDKKFIEYYNNTDMETYILTIMNMVSDYYHDYSVGNSLELVLVRIVYLEKEEEEMDLEINPDAENTLESFCNWQVTINPKELTHPNRHDLAVLLTRHDICSDNVTNCDLLGLAYVGTACKEDEACCINEDNGLLLGVTVAHELGHVMGCGHDELDSSGCPPQAEDQSYYVMSPYVKLRTTSWSNCSQKFITTFLDTALGECLLDEPQDQVLKLPNMPPGTMYDAQYQCLQSFGVADVCPGTNDRMCESLYCQTSESGCSSRQEPAADGTKCGENMWCYDFNCVDIGLRPEATNGGWGEWSQYGECSRTCGGGVKVAERKCDNPPPKHKGRYCLGQRKKYLTCNTKPCDLDAPTYREVQCTEFNTVPFRGNLHTWRPFKKKTKKNDPCELVCVNEKNSFVTLSPRVKNGTPCKPGTRNICVGGDCKNVGCDWVLESDAVDDDCGVCRGDGTQCSRVEGVFNKSTGRGYEKIVSIPAGSHNILVVELQPMSNTIAVSASDEKKFYLNGDLKEQQDGEYLFGSCLGIYLHTEPDKEELIIKGPTTEELVLYMVFFERKNQGVKYHYFVSSSNSSYKPQYDWEFLEWSPCSANCMGGTEESLPCCVERVSGKVSTFFCDVTCKPTAKTRPCNQQKCIYRWRTSEWGPCSGETFKSGRQLRTVECVHQNPHPDGDEIMTELSNCDKSLKPSDFRLCNKIKPSLTSPEVDTTKTRRAVGEIEEDQEDGNEEQTRISPTSKLLTNSKDHNEMDICKYNSLQDTNEIDKKLSPVLANYDHLISSKVRTGFKVPQDNSDVDINDYTKLITLDDDSDIKKCDYMLKGDDEPGDEGKELSTQLVGKRGEGRGHCYEKHIFPPTQSTSYSVKDENGGVKMGDEMSPNLARENHKRSLVGIKDFPCFFWKHKKKPEKENGKKVEKGKLEKEKLEKGKLEENTLLTKNMKVSAKTKVSRPIVDRIPVDKSVLIKVPLLMKCQTNHLSEEAEELMGDNLSAILDTPKQVIVTGKKANEEANEMKSKHLNATETS